LGCTTRRTIGDNELVHFQDLQILRPEHSMIL
jgi:hypothetical protein